MDNYFKALYEVNANDHTEKKNGLTYLSWAWAWAEVKKLFPDATYTIYENDAGWCYHTDGKTCWVKTGVTVNGIEHIEYLPVMDFRNRSIPVDSVTSFDVNKSIQRSLTKAVARHGLGLYIYAGEDLPEDPNESADEPKPKKVKKPAGGQPVFCSVCNHFVKDIDYNGTTITAAEIVERSTAKYGKPVCYECAKNGKV